MQWGQSLPWCSASLTMQCSSLSTTLASMLHFIYTYYEYFSSYASLLRLTSKSAAIISYVVTLNRCASMNNKVSWVGNCLSTLLKHNKALFVECHLQSIVCVLYEWSGAVSEPCWHDIDECYCVMFPSKIFIQFWYNQIILP